MKRQILPEEEVTINHGGTQVKIKYKDFVLVGNNTTLLIVCSFFVACFLIYMLLRG